MRNARVVRIYQRVQCGNAPDAAAEGTLASPGQIRLKCPRTRQVYKVRQEDAEWLAAKRGRDQRHLPTAKRVAFEGTVCVTCKWQVVDCTDDKTVRAIESCRAELFSEVVQIGKSRT